MTITMAIPSGSLEQPALALLKNAGFTVSREDRSYQLGIDDPRIDLIMLRPQDMPRYTVRGQIDVALCGYDCVVNAAAEEMVVGLATFNFSKVSNKPTRWVVAVQQDSPFHSVADLDGCTFESEMVVLASRWVEQQGIKGYIRLSHGATEIKPGRFCDAIVEVTETGRSLKRAGLRILAEVLQSTPRLITYPAAMKDESKRSIISEITERLTLAHNRLN